MVTDMAMVVLDLFCLLRFVCFPLFDVKLYAEMNECSCRIVLLYETSLVLNGMKHRRVLMVPRARHLLKVLVIGCEAQQNPKKPKKKN